MKQASFLCIVVVISLCMLYHYSFTKGYNECKAENVLTINKRIKENENLIYKLKTENKELKDELKTKDNQSFLNIDIPQSLRLCLQKRNCK